MNTFKEDLKPREKLAEYVRIITNHTDYELIEIEQTDKAANKMQGIMVCNYHIIYDDSDPLDPTVDKVLPRIAGGELFFAENPFPRKPVGTGKVAYLIADNEKTPKNSLSGEPLGWNLEFLAAHYDQGWFKVIDKKWERKIKKRHEAIKKALAEAPKQKHSFDRRYAVKGIGDIDERIKVEVEQPENVQSLIASFQKQLEEMKATNESLKAELYKKKSSKKEQKEEEEVQSFAE